MCVETEVPPEIWDLGRTGFSVLNRPGVVRQIGKAAGESDGSFAEAFRDLLGIDIEEELERAAGGQLPSEEGALRRLTARFGTDAFGST